MVKKYDVITFGSGVVDVFVGGDMVDIGKKMCVPTGAKMLIKELNFTVGGGGTNTAVSFSHLGHNVGFAGRLGEGNNADIIKREISKCGVDFIGVAGKEHTGYSVILGSNHHNRTILTYKGANDYLQFGELDQKKLKTAKWFYFASLMGRSFRTQERLVKFAQKHGIKVAYNPSEYQIREEKNHVKHILKYTDVLILNKDEAEILANKGKAPLTERLRALGPKLVCVTDGKHGGVVSDGINQYHFGVHTRIRVAERTGAGDAFASAFVSGILHDMSLEDAIQLGVANSESVIQKPGAKNGLLSLRKAKQIMKRSPVAIRRVKL